MRRKYFGTVIFILQEYETHTVTHPWFDKHGAEMVYCAATGTVTVFRAMLQPLRYKNKMYLGGAKTELGFEGKGKYLLIYPPQIQIQDYRNHECILIGGVNRYLIDRIETVYVGSKPIYNWAIVHRGGDNDF